MGLTVEQECPQCGGSIELDETDRVLRCPYCSVKNFLFTPNYFRFVLPHQAPDKEIIYAPYMRFKGNVYFCQGQSIGHRFVDITHIGVQVKGIPLSLGLRPQAMKMKFVSSDTQGLFMKFSLKSSDIVAKAARLSSGESKENLLHRAYIGETLSLIYMPLFVQSDKIFDAVLNRPVVNLPQDQETFKADMTCKPKWKLSFLPTICPSCGWNMDGEKDSIVLICGNCDSAWEAVEGKFRKIDLLTVSGQDGEAHYLPFWRISATAEGVGIDSFADFVRITNQPMIIHKEWEKKEMCFWTPAFKIRPKVFLRLSRQITISQLYLPLGEKMPKKGLYPVTLPRDESAQAMKITLAGSAVNKKNVFPHLPEIKFKKKDATLVYLPFSDTGHDMVLQNTRISINKQALEFGRKL